MAAREDHVPNETRQGDEEPAGLAAFEALYRSRFHQYLRVAQAVTGNPEDGLDAVQEGFARAIRFRKDFRGEAQLASWVWRCVVNSANASRHRRETTLAEDIPDVHATQPPPSGVSALIAELPERQRLALFLRYYADMDYRSIANVLGIRIGTVGATLNDARAKLRAELEGVKSK